MTFFSGTDTSTLKEEGRDRNNFVSLIVNNAGTYTAAITRRIKSKQIKEFTTYEFFGDGEKSDTKEYISDVDEIEWFYLKIEKEGENYSFPDIGTRLEEIKKQKEVKAKMSVPANGGYMVAQKPNIVSSQSVNVGPANINKSKVEQKPVHKPVQKTFFDDIKEDELPFDEMDTDIPYGKVCINTETIKSLIRQLITCSIIIPNESKVNIDKWVNNMSSLYQNRFGKGDDGMERFKEWVCIYIEFLTWNVEDKDLEAMGFDQTDIQSICAHDLIEALTKLPENDYIKAYIDELEKYLIL